MKDVNSVAKVSIGANPIHRFPKKFPHLTTSNFMQFNIATVMEMPKSSCHAKHHTFLRSLPMKRPCMGSAQVKKSAFFVPYRTVWPAFTDFREDTPHVTSDGTQIISNNPLISIENLCKMFAGSLFSTKQNPNVSVYDFATIDLNDTSSSALYKFTVFGRWAYKLFCSIGLPIPFPDFGAKETFSALPFLSIAKVYMDYYYPNQYAHYGLYATVEGYFNRNYVYTMTVQEMTTVLQAIYKVTYDSDYFISAFDTPILSARNVQSTDFEITDITTRGLSIGGVDRQGKIVQSQDNDNYGTPYSSIIPAVGSGGTIQASAKVHTQYIDNHLRALTNYIVRHSLSGSRALERYIADWGVALDSDKLRRCYKLAETSFPLQIGDVTSTADTYVPQTENGAGLGDYAGRSLAYDGDFEFDCDTPEDGLVVVVCTIVPDTQVVQGINRLWFHKTKLDYLTGDFDGLSIREIRQIELFSGMKRQNSNVVDGLFGFVPAYAEYKVGSSIISGDFKCDSINAGLQGFDLARLFSDEYNDASFNLSHDIDFVLGKDSEQFNRLFFDDTSNSDKFIVIHRCEVEHNIPAVPLYDMYDFEDGKKEVKLLVNGAKEN